MVSMQLARLYATCMLAGLLLSILLFLSGGLRFHIPLPAVFRARLPRLAKLPRLPLPRRIAGRLRAPVRTPRWLNPTPAVNVAPQVWMAPLAAAMFLALFGATGLATCMGLHWHTLPSLVAGVAGGAAGSWLAVLFVAQLLSGTATSVVGGTLIGTLAHVTVSVPADGVGAVAYIADGKRVTVPAKSEGGNALPKGKRVMIVDFRDRIAMVAEI